MSEPYRETDRSGVPFERRVADAYRALGYQVVHNIQLSGQQADLIARRDVEGAPPIVLTIECKGHRDPVGNHEVQAFVTAVTALSARQTVTGGVMVALNGFTKDGRAAGDGLPNVTLLAWDELAASLFSVSHQMRAFVADYEHSAIFLDYLHLAIEPLSWSGVVKQSDGRPSLDEVIEDWIANDTHNHQHTRSLFVLGDFGAGKTTLLRHLQYRTASAFLAGNVARIPLFVPLRDFRFTHDVSSLLRASFRESYYRDIPAELVWQRLDSGRFYVLLDGFDEMVERSDADRRAELFNALVPIIRSASPSVVTSRPSYFVERDELESLVAFLRDREVALTEPEHPTGVPGIADRLRRRLVARHREVRPGANAYQLIDTRTVRAVRLLPLDRERVEAFLAGREDELQAVGASSEEVLRFIDLTYDLTDLATRPLLLTLILESVLEGGLKVDDTGAQLGPAGLYEVYTRTKLDLDMAKGPSRHGGLSLEVRRLLAESLAMHMYESGLLETEFGPLAATLIEDNENLRREVEESGLTTAQVATDFATCSFVTLNDDGTCRFIHKSFRGFFVARTLQRNIRKGHPLFAEPVEWEVLYFLGGFAPTKPHTGEELWAWFKNRAKEPPARRNALVGFLYTRPDHDGRKISDAEISDAEFGRLRFDRGRMTDVSWRRCTVRRLELDAPAWKGIVFQDMHVSELVIQEGEVEVSAVDSTIDAIDVQTGFVRLSLFNSTVESASVQDADLELTIDAAGAGGLIPDTHAASETVLVDELALASSRVRIVNPVIGSCHANGSVVHLEGPESCLADWTLERCLVTVTSQETVRSPIPPRRSHVDAETVLIGPSPFVLGCFFCGVFGALSGATPRLLVDLNARGWGVVDGGKVIDEILGKRDNDGYRWGDVLIVTSEWYRREVSDGGRLPSAGGLERLAHEERSNPGRHLEGHLGELLSATRSEYLQILRDRWTAYDPVRLSGSHPY